MKKRNPNTLLKKNYEECVFRKTNKKKRNLKLIIEIKQISIRRILLNLRMGWLIRPWTIYVLGLSFGKSIYKLLRMKEKISMILLVVLDISRKKLVIFDIILTWIHMDYINSRIQDLQSNFISRKNSLTKRSSCE